MICSKHNRDLFSSDSWLSFVLCDVMNVVDVNIAGRVAQRSTLAAWQQSLFNNIPLLIGEWLLYYRSWKDMESSKTVVQLKSWKMTYVVDKSWKSDCKVMEFLHRFGRIINHTVKPVIHCRWQFATVASLLLTDYGVVLFLVMENQRWQWGDTLVLSFLSYESSSMLTSMSVVSNSKWCFRSSQPHLLW